LLSYLSDHLNNRPLDILVNTHLHSDHCGGNQAVQSHCPEVKTYIPYGPFEVISEWKTEKLSFDATGQICPRFIPTHRLFPGDECVWAVFRTGSSCFPWGTITMHCFFSIASIVF
jgi:glyoxylase-like metal-dependent hydrolase (beta-lactamase superfamily II)